MKKIVVFLLVLVSFGMVFSTQQVFAQEHHDEECIHIHESEESPKHNINFDVEPEDPIQRSSGGSSSGGDGSNNEDWYDIGQSLPHEVDYSGSQLLQWVKKGDILNEPTGGFGITGHSAIVEGIFYDSTYDQYYIRLIEAVSDGVTRGLLTPSRFYEKHGEIYRVPSASQNQIDNAVNFAKSQLGKSYFVAVWKNPYATNNEWYCSELVWASYWNQNIFVNDGNNTPFSAVILPADIADSNATKMILHYQYITYAFPSENGHIIRCQNYDTWFYHEFESQNSCFESCKICYLTIQTTSHVFNNNISSINNNTHRAYCSCGQYEDQNHRKYTHLGNQYCYDCNWSQSNCSHNYNHSYEPYSDYFGMSRHLAFCSCGDSQVKPCIGIMIDPSSPVYCALCGQQMSSNQILYSLLLPNGLTIVSGQALTQDSINYVFNEMNLTFIQETVTIESYNIIIPKEFEYELQLE